MQVCVQSTRPFFRARPSKTIPDAAHQQLTLAWWESRNQYELFVSESVLRECSAGDPDAAEKRLSMVSDVPLLMITEQALEIAEALIRHGNFLEKTMLNDEIVDEVRSIREAHAARFGYDPRAIHEDLKKQRPNILPLDIPLFRRHPVPCLLGIPADSLRSPLNLNGGLALYVIDVEATK